MQKYLSPADAAQFLDVHRSTLIRWEESGRLLHVVRTPGGHRRYLLSELQTLMEPDPVFLTSVG